MHPFADEEIALSMIDHTFLYDTILTYFPLAKDLRLSRASQIRLPILHLHFPCFHRWSNLPGIDSPDFDPITQWGCELATGTRTYSKAYIDLSLKHVYHGRRSPTKK